METKDSRWSAFVAWIVVALLIYAFAALALRAWSARFAFGTDIAILAGFIAARINNGPDATPLYKVDWLVAPVIAWIVAAMLTIGILCPWWWIVVIVPLIIAGYAAGDPAFGESLTSYLADGAFMYSLLLICRVSIAIEDAMNWLNEKYQPLLQNLFAYLFFPMMGFAIVGGTSGSLNLSAVGLVFFAGTAIAARDSKKNHLYNGLFFLLCMVNFILYLFKPVFVQPHQPLVGICALLLGLATSQAEHREKEDKR